VGKGLAEVNAGYGFRGHYGTWLRLSFNYRCRPKVFSAGGIDKKERPAALGDTDATSVSSRRYFMDGEVRGGGRSRACRGAGGGSGRTGANVSYWQLDAIGSSCAHLTRNHLGKFGIPDSRVLFQQVRCSHGVGKTPFASPSK
jgi:hypothetical protein